MKSKSYRDLKRIMQRGAAAVLAGSIIFSNTGLMNAYAGQAKATVDETLYLNLDYYGDISKANVVKGINFNSTESYTDYGKYIELINMSSTDKPEQADGSVTWKAPANGGKFFFQGSLEKESVQMPWSFDITYKHNGVVTDADKIGGASGLIEIDIDAIPNKHVSEYMQNNMVLMVAIPVDISDVYSVDAPDSQTVTLGQYSGVAFEALPGKEGHFSVRLGTDCFESMGVIIAMSPVTVGDLAEIKDLKEIKDKFRNNTNAMLDDVDALMDNISSMSTQLDKTNQMLDDLANGKSKIDANKNIIFNGVDVSLEDIRNLTALVDPLDTNIKTLQWMIYDVNKNLNQTDQAMLDVSAKMGTLSSRLKTFGNDLGGADVSLTDDLVSTSVALNGLKTSLGKSVSAAQYIASIVGSDSFKNSASDTVYGLVVSETEYEEEYLPEAVIEVINSSIQQLKAAYGSIAKIPDDQLTGQISNIAHALDLYEFLTSGVPNDPASPTGTISGVYVSGTTLKAIIGGLQAYQKSGDASSFASAVTTYVTGLVQKGKLDASKATAMVQLLTSPTQGIPSRMLSDATAESTEQAERFVNRLIALKNVETSAEALGNSTASGSTQTLSASVGSLSSSLSETAANALSIYSSIDYEELVNDIDGVMDDINDVMGSGANVSYQTARLLNSSRTLIADLDSLIGIMNTYYNDIQDAAANMSNLLEQFEKTSADAVSTGQILNNTLRAASADLSKAADEGIEVGREAVSNAQSMIENTNNIKNTGKDLRKTVNDEIDEQEAENNFLNMDPEAPKISLTDSRNQEPTSIAIICRTEEIKADTAKAAESGDAEFAAEQSSVFGRIKAVFTTLAVKIKSLLGKE